MEPPNADLLIIFIQQKRTLIIALANIVQSQEEDG